MKHSVFAYCLAAVIFCICQSSLDIFRLEHIQDIHRCGKENCNSGTKFCIEELKESARITKCPETKKSIPEVCNKPDRWCCTSVSPIPDSNLTRCSGNPIFRCGSNKKENCILQNFLLSPSKPSVGKGFGALRQTCNELYNNIQPTYNSAELDELYQKICRYDNADKTINLTMSSGTHSKVCLETECKVWRYCGDSLPCQDPYCVKGLMGTLCPTNTQKNIPECKRLLEGEQKTVDSNGEYVTCCKRDNCTDPDSYSSLTNPSTEDPSSSAPFPTTEITPFSGEICGDSTGCNFSFCVVEGDKTVCPIKDEFEFCRNLSDGYHAAYRDVIKCCKRKECLRKCGSNDKCLSAFCTAKDHKTNQTVCPDERLSFDQGCMNLTEGKGFGYSESGKICCKKDSCVRTCGNNNSCPYDYCIFDTETSSTICPKHSTTALEDKCGNLVGDEKRKGYTTYNDGGKDKVCCKMTECSRPCGSTDYCGHQYCLADSGGTFCPNSPDLDDQKKKLVKANDLACSELEVSGEIRLEDGLWCCKAKECPRKARVCGSTSSCMDDYCVLDGEKTHSECASHIYGPEEQLWFDDRCLGLEAEEGRRIHPGWWCCNKTDGNCEGEAKYCGNYPCSKNYCIMKNGKTTCPANDEFDHPCNDLLENGEWRLNHTTWCCNKHRFCTGEKSVAGKVKTCGSDTCKRYYCIGEAIGDRIHTSCPVNKTFDEQCNQLPEGEERLLGPTTWCCNNEKCFGKKRKCGDDDDCRHYYCMAKKTNGQVSTYCPPDPKKIQFRCLSELDITEEYELSLGREEWCCRNHSGNCPAITRTCGDDLACQQPYCLAEGPYSNVKTFCPKKRNYDRECANLKEGEERRLADGTWCCKLEHCYGVARMCGSETDGSQLCKHHFCVRDDNSESTRCPTSSDDIEKCKQLPKIEDPSIGNSIHIPSSKITCCSMTKECSGSSRNSVKLYHYSFFIVPLAYKSF